LILPKHLPDILYPPINLKTFEKSPTFSGSINELLGGSHDTIITSLNRYERKKNIPLAIKAFAKSEIKGTLVIAGGWDPRVEENV
jgi:alpha-1,3/alpha-1,6-mannosyltransferase